MNSQNEGPNTPALEPEDKLETNVHTNQPNPEQQPAEFDLQPLAENPVAPATLEPAKKKFQFDWRAPLMYLWKEWVRPIGEAVIIALVITTFVFTTVAIDGTSDEPNVHHGERVFVPKYEMWLARLGLMSFKRGDLVVLKPPKPAAHSERPIPLIGNYFPNLTYRPFFIKRIVGEPGDRVKLVAGQLYVNGIQVDESHTTAFWRSIKGGYDNKALWDNTSGLSNSKDWSFTGAKLNAQGEYVVPKGKYFVMGDNRSLGGSEDSRYFGPVPLEEFAGRATFVWWPPVASMQEVKAQPGSGGEGQSWWIIKHDKFNSEAWLKGPFQVRFNMRPLPTPQGFVKLEQQLKAAK